jgi:very-short-patch-repair endonuclease
VSPAIFAGTSVCLDNLVHSSGPAIRGCEVEARRQHGVIGRSHAKRYGLSDQAIARLVRSGQWQRLLPGTYLVGGAPLTWHAQLKAAQLWLGSDCLFSHRTAAALIELDGVAPGWVEVAVARGIRARGVVVHRLSRDDRPRSVWVQGFRTTNVERTLFDLFSVLPRRAAELALEDALRRRLTTLNRLWDIYREAGGPGRNGSRGLRAALLMRDNRDGSLASRMETGLLRTLRSLPGPQAVPQYEVRIGNARFSIDFAYPDVQLGIEAHSLRWHMGQERWQRDLVRDRKLKRAGWTVLYYSWDDIHLRSDDLRSEILDIRGSLSSER